LAYPDYVRSTPKLAEKFDDGQKRKIAEFYAAGKTIPKLAEEYGCGVGTIWRALQPETREAA
jgi:hypothetical protein